MTKHTLTPNRLAVLEANSKKAAKIRKEQAIANQSERQTLYTANPAFCANCHDPISFEKRENKYCSKSCSATATNKAKGQRTEETKEKISNALAGRPGKRNHKTKTAIQTSCVVCDTVFSTFRNGKRTRKTCSPQCLTEQRSKVGRKSAANRVVRSKDEIKLYELCVERFVDAQHNVILVDGWDADISIPSLKLAILWNGIWHREQLSFKNHSLAQVRNRDRIKIETLTKAGWQVLVYEDNEFTPQTAFEDLVGRTGLEPVTPEL